MKNKQQPNQKPTDVSVNIVSEASSGFLSITFTRRQPQKGEFKAVDWSRRVRSGAYRVYMLGRGDRLTDAFLDTLARAYAGILPVWKQQRQRATNTDEFRPLYGDLTWQEFIAAAGRKEHKKDTP